MLKVLASDQFSPVALVDIRLAGSTEASSLRFTDAGETVVFGGNTYLPVSMSRSEMREVMSTDSGDQSAVTLTVANFDSAMATLLNRVELEGARVTYRIHDRRLLKENPDRTRDAFTAVMGEVRGPVLSASTLVLQIVTVLGLMDAFQLPKRDYQSVCNATFGSASCGANIADFTYSTTIGAASTRNMIAVSSTFLDAIYGDADPNDFFINGYVVFQDGINTLQSRPIAKIQLGGVRHIFVRYPFLNTPSAGDSILIV